MIVQRYGTTMLRLAYAQLGRRQLAEDAVQEALIRLFLHRDRFSGSEFERQYAMKTVINACRDIQRTAWYRKVRPAAPGAFPPSQPDWPESGLLRHIGQLAPRLREALLVRFYLGFDTAEAAGMLGVSRSALRDRVRKAKAALAESLEKDDENAIRY